MSEYWKSTPKYWCKHCKIFVRDTKLEKANHDATPKHQGNLKRFLRDLHRGHEKDEKDKERAKSEVARLNGLVSGNGSASGSGSIASSSGIGRGPTPSAPSAPKPQATAAQRKQQLAQLAEMGVSIPDEFRGDMAMAGEWQVTEERIIGPGDGETKPDALAMGVRKRAAPGDEDEDEVAEAKKKRFGSSYRTYPTGEDNSDLDALLSKPMRKVKSETAAVKSEPGVNTEVSSDDVKIKSEPTEDPSCPAPEVKTEPIDEIKLNATEAHPVLTDLDIKPEPEATAGSVMFKKRKAKNIRQK